MIPSYVRVTVDGHSQIEQSEVNPDASKAFIAMWFDETMDALFENGIAPAIREAGYEPVRIDRKLDVDKIDDAIIAEIRRSRFIVADFTHEGKRCERRCLLRGWLCRRSGDTCLLYMP